MFGKPYAYRAKLTPRSSEKATSMKQQFAEATTNIPSLEDASNAGGMEDMERLVKILEKDPDATQHTTA